MTLTNNTYLIAEGCLLLSTLTFVTARLGVRVWRRTWSFWVSDICLLGGVLCQAALFFGDIANFMRGRTDFSAIYDDSYGKWMYSSWVIFDACFYFPRYSLLAFYYQLFPISERNMRIWLYVAIGYTTAGFMSNLFVNLLWCGPDVSQNWEVDSAQCALTLTLIPLYINWSIGISCELAIFMLPMPLLWKMKKLQKREKAALAFVLFLGVITIAISVTRFTMMALLNYEKETFLVGAAEYATQTSIVAVPALRPLLGVVRVPSTIRSWTKPGTAKSCGGSTSRTNTGKSGTSNSGACYYDPGVARPEGDDSVDIKLPELKLSSSWWQDIERLEEGGEVEEGVKVEDDGTDRIPEPWEAITLPCIID